MDYGMGLVDSAAVFTDYSEMSHVYKGRARLLPPKSQLGRKYNMLPFVETICKLTYRILRIVFGLYLCTKFFLGNREESHTLWYGIACLILFI